LCSTAFAVCVTTLCNTVSVDLPSW
jgi:hypothetical protein